MVACSILLTAAVEARVSAASCPNPRKLWVYSGSCRFGSLSSWTLSAALVGTSAQNVTCTNVQARSWCHVKSCQSRVMMLSCQVMSRHVKVLPGGGDGRGNSEVGKEGGGSRVGLSGKQELQSLMKVIYLKAAASSQKPASKICTNTTHLAAATHTLQVPDPFHARQPRSVCLDINPIVTCK